MPLISAYNKKSLKKIIPFHIYNIGTLPPSPSPKKRQSNQGNQKFGKQQATSHIHTHTMTVAMPMSITYNKQHRLNDITFLSK